MEDTARNTRATTSVFIYPMALGSGGKDRQSGGHTVRGSDHIMSKGRKRVAHKGGSFRWMLSSSLRADDRCMEMQEKRESCRELAGKPS